MDKNKKIVKDKVAVVIPCYNHAKYLKQSIESIIEQTYKNMSIIIVNDGSDESQTLQIDSIVNQLKKTDNRIEYFSYKKNSGKWFALNLAVEHSDAEFITSHDADDVSLPQRIERQLHCLKLTNSIHNLCSFYHCYDDDDIKKHYAIKFETSLQVVPADQVSNLVLIGANTVGINHYFTGNIETAGTSAMFLKRAWDLGVRFNPPGAGLRVLLSEDSDFNFRMTMLFGKTTILNEKLYCYRRNTSTNKEEM